MLFIFLSFLRPPHFLFSHLRPNRIKTQKNRTHEFDSGFSLNLFYTFPLVIWFLSFIHFWRFSYILSTLQYTYLVFDTKRWGWWKINLKKKKQITNKQTNDEIMSLSIYKYTDKNVRFKQKVKKKKQYQSMKKNNNERKSSINITKFYMQQLLITVSIQQRENAVDFSVWYVHLIFKYMYKKQHTLTTQSYCDDNDKQPTTNKSFHFCFHI